MVWSESVKEVILIELTVGDESNFSDQVVRKEARYNRELIPGITASGWKARLFKIEVGCRGFWHHTVPALFNYFGLGKRVKKQVLEEAALVALKCSYPMLSGWQETTRSGLPAITSLRDPHNHRLSKLSVGPVKHV